MSVSGEPPVVVNNFKAKVLDTSKHLLKQRARESPDLSKASPSNGQCPTAVSSRNQTIASREIPRPKRMGSSSTPSDYQPAGIVVIKQDQFRPLQTCNDDGTISVGTAGERKVSLGKQSMHKQFTFKEARTQKRDSSFESSVEDKDQDHAGGGMQEYEASKNILQGQVSRNFKRKLNDGSIKQYEAGNEHPQHTSMLIRDKISTVSSDAGQRSDYPAAISARNNRNSRDDNLRLMRQSNQGQETVSYKLKMKNNVVGTTTDSTKERNTKTNEPSQVLLPSNNQLLKNNNAVIELNKSQALQQDALMNTSRSKYNNSPQGSAPVNYKPEESTQSKTFDAQVYQITGYEQSQIDDEDYAPDFPTQFQNLRPNQSLTQPSIEEPQTSSSFEQNKQSVQRKVVKVKHPPQTQYVETPKSMVHQQQINSVRGTRDESPSFFKDSQQLRNQQQRLSQPENLKSQASRQDSSQRSSPKQNARTFIIRTSNLPVAAQQQGVHQPKVLPPVARQQINKKLSVKTPVINQNGVKVAKDSRGSGSNQGSPTAIDHIDAAGNIRRLSQNQNSINMYLDQESKFDSTKDASEFMGGAGTSSLVKDCGSSLPDSIKVKGGAQDRSYDEAWPIDQGSQNSMQHGEGSCDQRLDSAQTSLLQKRRPSDNRLNQEFFDQSVQRSEELEQFLPAPAPGKSKKHIQQMSQPRAKDYARQPKTNNMRGTLQSQNNQSSFVDDIEEEYSSKHAIAQQCGARGDSSKGKKNYHSPVHLREIGLSQQMVPNQMKQQLKQRRTVYGQSFFNSPPYPSPLINQEMVNVGADPMTTQLFEPKQPSQKQRNTQIDSSLRRKRQLPVPQYPPQQSAKNHPSGIKKLTSNQEILQTRNSMQQSFPLQLQAQMTHQPTQPPQSQQRRTLQRHIDSTTQHLEFDERQQNVEGKISQLSRFNAYHAGMRNVLTAGENSPRVVDHFPVSRASRWKNQAGANLGSNNYDIMQQEVDSGADPTAQVFQRPVIPLQEDRCVGSAAAGQFHNQKKLPKRSGTASYITQGGVRITINKDNKHLNGANLTTTTEENMNLMFYDFNNAAVIPEETQRNMLRSQTTDRGPSRKLRSRGRFKLASSNQQKRADNDQTGFGEIRPFEVSTEFEMGMYPPGTFPPGSTIGPTGVDFSNVDQLQPAKGHKNAPELTIHSSPHKMDGTGEPGKNSKSGTRNIQGKRLSSQTVIQRSAQGGRSQPAHVSAMISSNQGHQEQSASPNNSVKNNSLAHSSGQRRVQKKYRADPGFPTGQMQNESHGNAGVAVINRSLPKKNFVPGPGLGYRNFSREGASKHGDHTQINNQQQQAVKPLSRIPQHRQTNLANVMECIREEEPHL